MAAPWPPQPDKWLQRGHFFGTGLGPLEGHLESILASSWPYLGALGAILAPTWGVSGPSWKHLGASWGHLGTNLGLLESMLRESLSWLCVMLVDSAYALPCVDSTRDVKKKQGAGARINIETSVEEG